MGQQSFAYIMSSLLLNWYVETGKMHNAQTYWFESETSQQTVLHNILKLMK